MSAAQYPNEYYEQLAQLVIKYPNLSTRNEEVCFYQGDAQTFKTTSREVEKPKKKTSFLITPWFVGVKRKKTVEVKQETKTKYFRGQLFITNMRVVFKCPANGFDLLLTEISGVSHNDKGIIVSSGRNKYNVLTSDVEEILRIMTLMNNAQEPPATDSCASSVKPGNNEDYAIAAFVRYCSFGGKPIGKRRDVYPSYLNYKFNITAPIKYHKKMIEEGYLCEAPLANSLKLLKVDQLKQILLANGLPEKGKKDELIQRIVEEVDPATLTVDKVYVPTEKGLEHLRKYEHLFAE